MQRKKETGKQVVGLLGCGEIGSAIARICKEAGFEVLIRELKFDEISDNKIDYFHVNIPDKNNKQFINTIVKNVKELKPKLTVINSSTTPGTVRKIYDLTKVPIIHSPVIGLHPHLYDFIKYHFPKIIGPIDGQSLKLAKKHFKALGLRIEVYDSPENSETAKLLDLVYYAWNIIFAKWLAEELCPNLNLNFNQVYTKHNQIYNDGYGKFLPNVIRPVLIPFKGPIGGHCTIPDSKLLHKCYKNRFTKFILDEQKKYLKQNVNESEQRKAFLKIRDKHLSKVKKTTSLS